MGKDAFYELFRFPVLLEYLLRYASGQAFMALPQIPEIMEALRRLLCPQSHPLLRREGMRLVMLWMKGAAGRQAEDLRLIFASAVELRQFNADSSITIGQPDYPGNLNISLV